MLTGGTQCKALVPVRDLKTEQLHQPGEVFALERTDEEIKALVDAGIVEVVPASDEPTPTAQKKRGKTNE